MKTFEASYTKRSGGHKEYASIYYRAKTLQEAFIEFMLSFDFDKERIVAMFAHHCYSWSEPETESIELDGEWLDDISHGGDWIFTDLVVKEVDAGSLPCKAILTEKDLSMSDAELGAYVRKHLQREPVYKVTIDLSDWKLRYAEDETV